MATIKLRGGTLAYVDDSDYERIDQFLWYRHDEGYVMRNVPPEERDGLATMQYLQHFLVEVPAGYQIRFKDGNRLNCRRSNLEFVTPSDARRMARPRWNGSSKYKGVCFNKRTGKWMATIRLDNKARYLGLFADEVAAARAYDAAVRTHCGNGAYVNFPDLSSQPST